MNADTGHIPNWNLRGVLPPVPEGTDAPLNRSPYPVSLTDFVLRFGNTEPRREIVSGFLEFRGALQTIGLVKGFQWIDGSFVEDIETVERRAPADIDVVTFIHLPDDTDQATLNQHSPRLFDPTATIDDFGVDAYFVQLNTAVPESLVARSAYWYSLWSHRRDGRWKGYLQIDLSPADDDAAKAQLDAMLNERGQP